MSFLQEWAKDDGNRLSVGQNGMLQINTEGYEAGSNPAIDDLIEMNGAKERIGFEGSPDPKAETPENQSKTSRNVFSSPEKHMPHGSIPPPGFDGNIVFPTKAEFSDDKGNQIPRGQIVGHEMRENYLRTHNGLDYASAHARANLRYYGGNNQNLRIKLK